MKKHDDDQTVHFHYHKRPMSLQSTQFDLDHEQYNTFKTLSETKRQESY